MSTDTNHRAQVAVALGILQGVQPTHGTANIVQAIIALEDELEEYE